MPPRNRGGNANPRTRRIPRPSRPRRVPREPRSRTAAPVRERRRIVLPALPKRPVKGKPTTSPAPHHRATKLPHRPKGIARVNRVANAAPASLGLTSAQWNARYGNTTANTVKAQAVYTQIKMRYPMVGFGGIGNCRKQRGTGSDPNRWSVHSVGGAVDVWPNSGPVQSIIDFAKSVPGVWDAWLDASPGDVHVQIVPNPPADWVPPCAGGTTGQPAPITDPLWNLLRSVGFSENVKVPFEPFGLSAIEMAWCIAKAESGGDLSPGGNLFQFVTAPPRTAKANAFRAFTESGTGTVWVAWCTAFGGPRVPPHNAKANCGHQGPNYLHTVQGISPAYFQFVQNLPSKGGVPGGGGRGGGRETSKNATPDIRFALPANCAEAKARGTGGVNVIKGIKNTPTATEGTAQIVSGLKDAVCHVPVFGDVSCGLASFFAHFPQYLKIAAGGTIMFGGLALIIAGATGNTSKLSNATQTVIQRTRRSANPQVGPTAAPKPGTQTTKPVSVERASKAITGKPKDESTARIKAARVAKAEADAKKAKAQAKQAKADAFVSKEYAREAKEARRTVVISRKGLGDKSRGKAA